MEEFKGFVFVCYDRNAMSLADYLAGAGEYLAYVADQGRDGMEIVAGTQDYCVGANWKLLQENSADGYHGRADPLDLLRLYPLARQRDLHQHRTPRAG